jgi:hypothetical protein
MHLRLGDVYSLTLPMEPSPQASASTLKRRDIPKATGCLKFLRYGMGIATTFSDFDRFAVAAAMIPVAADFCCCLIC